MKCTLCPLHEASHINCIKGDGPQPANILFIAEGPGEEEERTGIPLVGPSGQLFNKMLSDAGIPRSMVRVCNTVSCRPVDKKKVWEDRKGVKHFGNRAPTLEEIYTCAPLYLDNEIQKTNPVVIVPLGNVAMHYVMGEYRVASTSRQGEYNVPKVEKAISKAPSIMNARGIEIWSNRYTCKVIPVIHPVALLRSPRKMGETVEDLRRVLIASQSREKSVRSPVNYVLVDKWEDVQWVLARLREVPKFATDCETTGLDFLRHKIVSIGFSWKANTGVAIRVLDASGLPIWTPEQWDQIVSALTDIFQDENKTVIAHSAKFDMQMLMAAGVSYPVHIVDTMLMHHILDPESGHGLKELSRSMTDMGGYDDELERYREDHPEAKNHYELIPWEILGYYNCGDCDATFRLHDILSAKLAERPVTHAFFHTWILPFIEVVTEMERVGIGLDFGRVKRLYKEMEAKCAEVEREFSAQLGVIDINLGSPQQLAKLFFGELKMPVIRRSEKTGEPSVDEDTILELAKLYPDNKLLMLLLEYRSLQKTMSTYLIGFKDAALFGRYFGGHDVPSILSRTCWAPGDAREKKILTDARIHSDYSMQVTPTGRLASKGPNMQNLKRVTDEDLKKGWTIRPNLIARDGYSFIESDFKQGEVFVGASLCRDTNLINDMLSKEGVHRRVYGRIYNIDPTTVTDAQKSIAKPVVFGTFYGQQADGLAELLKIPLEQAEDLIARFFNQYPGLKFWIDSTISCARKLGYVDTVFGRRRYLPAINSPDMKSRANSEHYAVNTPIQATCHDLLIIASVKIMRDIQTESLPMALVAENHDAFIYEVRDDAVEECQAIIKRRMEEPVIPELIPMQAEIEISKSWKAKIDEEVPDAPEVPVADEVVLA